LQQQRIAHSSAGFGGMVMTGELGDNMTHRAEVHQGHNLNSDMHQLTNCMLNTDGHQAKPPV